MTPLAHSDLALLHRLHVLATSWRGDLGSIDFGAAIALVVTGSVASGLLAKASEA